MASELDAAIRGVLVQYAKAKGLEGFQQEAKEEETEEEAEGGEKGVKNRPAKQIENEKHSKVHVDATNAKKAKILQVARMLVDNDPRIRNRGMLISFFSSFYSSSPSSSSHSYSSPCWLWFC